MTMKPVEPADFDRSRAADLHQTATGGGREAAYRDELKKLRDALSAIADLGSCGHGKKKVGDLFQQAIDIAVKAL